jgi:hypothetical protein
MIALEPDELTAFVNAMGGEKLSLDKLSSAVRKMVANLASSIGGDMQRARRIFIEACKRPLPSSPDLQSIFEAMLPRIRKKKGPANRLDDFEFLTIWECWQRANPGATRSHSGAGGAHLSCGLQ